MSRVRIELRYEGTEYTAEKETYTFTGNDKGAASIMLDDCLRAIRAASGIEKPESTTESDEYLKYGRHVPGVRTATHENQIEALEVLFTNWKAHKSAASGTGIYVCQCDLCGTVQKVKEALHPKGDDS